MNDGALTLAADEITALACVLGSFADGGVGLEPFFKSHFPKAACILDFLHAKECLVELSHALHDDEAARQTWLDDECDRPKHEGGPTARQRLEELDMSETTAASGTAS